MTSYGVLFDLDDTLYDEITFVSGAMGDVARFLASMADADVGAIHDLLLLELARSGRGRVFDAVLVELGLPARLVPTLVYVYRSARPRLELFSDAGPLLDALARHGVAAGILTDGNAMVQYSKLQLLGLRSRMDVVVLTDAVGPGTPKPDTLGFEIACDLFGLPPERVSYVANDLRKDFAGPRTLGMQAIHVAHRQLGQLSSLEQRLRPDVIVERLADVWPHVYDRTEADK
jgi:putative hydrolase of the HAD superfamily